MDIDNIKHLVPPEVSVRMIQSTIINLDPLTLTSGLTARRAPSCLIAPRIGDSVICSVIEDFHATILAVTERQSPESDLPIEVDTPVMLRSPEFHFTSEKFNIESAEMTVNVGLFNRFADRVEDVVEYLNTTVNALFTRAKRSIKRTEDIEDIQAGHLKMESSTITELHAEVSIISGEKLIQLQGQQIHMG